MTEMNDSRRLGGRGAMAGVALWLSVGLSGAVGATTLQEMFDGSSFTQDGLIFSDFKPVLNDSLPSVGEVQAQLAIDPQGVSSLPFLDFTNGVFSKGTGNTQPAIAGNIDLAILPDDTGTTGIDPGFALAGAAGTGEWVVDATNDVASAQLSAFAYKVSKTSTGKQINSAGVLQTSSIDAVGPDTFSLLPFELPDVAGGFALQFILDDPNGTDLNSALMNYTLKSGIQTLSGVVPSPFDQAQDWSSFTDRDAIRVVSVIGLGASSGGAFTMDSVSQRIDPPPPAIPEPATLLLFGVGMLGLGFAGRAAGQSA